MDVVRTVFCVSLALASFASAQSELKKTVRELRAAMLRNPDGPTPGQLLALEDFGVDFRAIVGSDLRSMGIVLEHAAKSSGEELGQLIVYGLSERGHDLRWAMTMVAIHRKRYDDAAKLVIAACMPVSEGLRSYRVWKWWHHVMAARPDYWEATREFSLALLQRSQNGNDKEKRAVQDIIGKGEITAETLPKLRQQAIDGVKKGNARFKAQWQADSVGKPKTMWIEDRSGLRQIERQSFWRRARASWRRELRLGTSGAFVLPIQLFHEFDRFATGVQRAVELGGGEVGPQFRSLRVVYVVDHCSDSMDAFEAGDLGEQVHSMLGRFVRASREGDESPQVRRLVFATLRVAAVESRRLLTGEVSMNDFEVLSEFPASAVAGAVARFVGGAYQGPDGEGKAFAVDAGTDLTLMTYIGGGLSVVQFRSNASVVVSFRLSDEVLASATVATPNSEAGDKLVSVAWKDGHPSFQANAAPGSKDLRMVRKPIARFEVRCSSSEQQAAVATKLRAFGTQ